MNSIKNKLFKFKLILLFLFGLQNNFNAQVDPCENQLELTCGISTDFSLGPSLGIWNPPGPWGTPGSEAVFSYTPETSGLYNIFVTNDNYYVDLFYQADECDQFGWTYVNDIYFGESNSLNLIAGTTYFFLIDDENTTASNGTINISCPCNSAPGGIDSSIIIVNNFTVFNSSTINACNDCNYRPSNDKVIEFEIICEGDYTFTLCEGAEWDTYLYLSDQPCSGNIISFNDDDCGLQSSITSNLNIGSYYLTVEGWSASSQGEFDLNISTTCSFSPLPVELIYFEGENLNRKNQLEWLTASEYNNDYFTIERSTDAVNFEEIEITQGQGTTNENTLYQFTDETFIEDVNYYRLTQTDINGNQEIFDVVFIESKPEKEMTIYPNPSDNIVTFLLNSDSYSEKSILILQNEIGQIIFEKKFNENNQIVLNLEEYSGVYFAKIRTENKTYIEKLVIQ